AGEDMRKNFFQSMSQNRASDIIEAMESRGRVSLREINDARNQILNTARVLEDDGSIVIKKGKEEFI
ncbi:MAG: flagellar motor switch protein FliG, partial [Leptospira sp.]|nr:flagellar motor switch protein FliG [Leptospira sp.]